MVKLPKLKINHLCDKVLSFPILVDAKTGDTIRDQKRLDEIIRRCAAFEKGGLVADVRNQLMDLYSSCVDTATPEVYGTILGLHEKLEAALAKS